ncbi:MAG: hypothetical protein ACP5ID_04880, partial [Conexivisphaera sp.]
MHWRMVALAVALSLALLLPVPAAAQSSGSISLSTYFTGVTVQGGQYVYTTVNVTNQMETPASISLSTSAPPGWSAVLTYNGYNVTA